MTLSPRRWAALATSALVLGLLPGAVPAVADPAPTAAEMPSPGAAGMGDPYFPLDGNGGIDVVRYEVHDTYDFTTRHLSGWTRLTVRATQALSRFDLDLLLPVQGVTVDGVPAAYAKPDLHELRVTPASPIARGDRVQVLVRYAGQPEKLGWNGEHNWLADDSEVVAMNEPHMAPWWFPANDHPRDRALMDLHITTAADKQVVANGHLVGREVHGRRATTHWRAAEPMVPYLAFFAAGHFVIRHGVHDGLPWYVAVSDRIPTSTRNASLRLMERTPGIVTWLERQLGHYPFADTGGLTTSLNPGFALENQTRPTYPVLTSEAVTTVVHELAHQWFGDSVAVANWRDIWLNEGAATFMEARYAETHGGQSAQQWLEYWYDTLADDADFWTLQVDDPGRDHIFDWQVYQRGGMALQALRHRIGNDDYWRLLRQWVHSRAGGNGSTRQFEALAEQVSGQQLDGFFKAWLVDPTRPARTAANGLG
ncbi:aminopeptidase N [Nocardioides ginsengisegetis]|uniref:Aminopeptidase N n=1 Tax=Nocardioides ginsengisegetis TaxID=661491 RepID=A0A7W3PA08_9ACTN|nr:aminopeptidase N [Nocardioides ginsengisegetis]